MRGGVVSFILTHLPHIIAPLLGLAFLARFALYVRRLPLRLLGVELSPLSPPDRQTELFPDPASERQRRLRPPRHLSQRQRRRCLHVRAGFHGRRNQLRRGRLQ